MPAIRNLSIRRQAGIWVLEINSYDYLHKQEVVALYSLAMRPGDSLIVDIRLSNGYPEDEADLLNNAEQYTTQANGYFAVVVSPEFRRTLERMGFTHLWCVTASLEEAVALIQRSQATNSDHCRRPPKGGGDCHKKKGRCYR